MDRSLKRTIQEKEVTCLSHLSFRQRWRNLVLDSSYRRPSSSFYLPFLHQVDHAEIIVFTVTVGKLSRAHWLIFIINKSTDRQNFTLCENQLHSSTVNFLTNENLLKKVAKQKARRTKDNVRAGAH